MLSPPAVKPVPLVSGVLSKDPLPPKLYGVDGFGEVHLEATPPSQPPPGVLIRDQPTYTASVPGISPTELASVQLCRPPTMAPLRELLLYKPAESSKASAETVSVAPPGPSPVPQLSAVQPEDKGASVSRQPESKKPAKQIPVISTGEEAVLRWGCWPLLSPGLRDWEKATPISITLPVTAVQWPPRNWKEMTGAQRLFAMQTVAAMVSLGDQTAGDFTTASPSSLAEGFNFLALPGGGTTQDRDRFARLQHEVHGVLKSSQQISSQQGEREELLDILGGGRQRGPPARNELLQQVEDAQVPLLPYYKGQTFQSGVEQYDPSRPHIEQ